MKRCRMFTDGGARGNPGPAASGVVIFELDAKGGQNYFVRQYIKFGVVVGGANFELVSEEEGKQGVLECKLAQ